MWTWGWLAFPSQAVCRWFLGLLGSCGFGRRFDPDAKVGIILLKSFSFKMETQMVSVERVLEYSQIQIEPQEEGAMDGMQLDGSVALEGFSMRYAAGGPLCLREVSVAITAGQHVGVVGRTGAGKSSLLVAALRLCEGCAGVLRLGGAASTSLSLARLRSL